MDNITTDEQFISDGADQPFYDTTPRPFPFAIGTPYEYQAVCVPGSVSSGLQVQAKLTTPAPASSGCYGRRRAA
jgi:hypothetical protein